MEVTKNIFLSENDIINIITVHLQNEGYRIIGNLEINVKSKIDIPEGATPGDVIGINAKVEDII